MFYQKCQSIRMNYEKKRDVRTRDKTLPHRTCQGIYLICATLITPDTATNLVLIKVSEMLIKQWTSYLSPISLTYISYCMSELYLDDCCLILAKITFLTLWVCSIKQ
jgi:hypothetical protein